MAMAMTMRIAAAAMAVVLLLMSCTRVTEATCGDRNAATFAQGTQLLKSTVVSCVQGSPFRMPVEGGQLLSNNIPNDFHTQNAQRALVQVEYTVVQSNTLQTSWFITIDVDNATTGARPQNAHYGYTIYGRNPTVGRVTGHIFFPNNLFPPHVRPPLNATPNYNIVNFAASSRNFRLNGVNYFLRT